MRRLIAVLATLGAVALGVAYAAPAMASGTPVSVNATVSATTLTVSGITSSINFGTITPGTPSTDTAAEVYDVTTNDPAGYTVTITPADDGLESPDQNFLIPNTDISVTETNDSPGTYSFDSTNAIQVSSQSGPGVGTYSENWTVSAPATIVPNTYSQVFTYLALAN